MQVNPCLIYLNFSYIPFIVSIVMAVANLKTFPLLQAEEET